MYMFEGMAVEFWISHQFLRGSTLSIPTYSKSLRSTLQGGELEIQVFAVIYQTEVVVFQVLDLHSYRKIFRARASITPVEQVSRVCILYTPGHFDWARRSGGCRVTPMELLCKKSIPKSALLLSPFRLQP